MAFPGDYTLLQTITVDNTKVSGSANLTDFPTLFTEANFLANTFSNTDNGGGDLRFSLDEAGSSQLSCEIVTWDTGTSKAQVWVKALLDHDDNTVIYVWGDKTGESQPASNAAFGSESVWTSNYKGVWHLDEASGNALDSTSNSNNLTDTNTVGTGTGKVGTGRDFEKDNSEHFTIADNASLSITGDISISCWFNLETLASTASEETHIVGKYAGGDQRSYRLYIATNDKITFQFSDLGTGFNSQFSVTTALVNGDLGTLHHLVILVDVSVPSMVAVLNGSSVGVTDDQTADTSIYDGTGPFTLGELSGLSREWDGILDEAHVYSGLLTSDWAITEHANQNNPSTFAEGAAISSIGGILLGMGMI